MNAFRQFDRQKSRGFVSALCFGLLVASLALVSAAFAAGGGGAGGGAGGAGTGAGGGAMHKSNEIDLTTCAPDRVWDTKRHKCLTRHSGVLPDPDLMEYAYALAKANRYQEAIDVLDPNTPRALNYRGYATRNLDYRGYATLKLGAPTKELAMSQVCRA